MLKVGIDRNKLVIGTANWSALLAFSTHLHSSSSWSTPVRMGSGYKGTLLWTNNDVPGGVYDSLPDLYGNGETIFTLDGTIYLAASCPINAETGEEVHDYCLHPTSQPIDPNSLLQGYLVGCRLRAMRGKV